MDFSSFMEGLLGLQDSPDFVVTYGRLNIEDRLLMKTLLIDHGKKLKAVRLSEGMTQIEFSHVLGIGLGTIKNYGAGIRGVGLVILDRVTNHPKFSKYTLWLMTNSTAPEYG
ncbi:helix-turn-helix domain-containing protein [Arsenophonus endosymbiont of Aleurodicus floccissimus]|uniref:helix-turn-helix domain-containing protein n=1 Tax=Arsenophonus endosymbiont of Aleurodicus floccissimus TaxID=2152761 RepID=UPI0015FEC7F6|nr:helix-turn-helix transcriptional regulator [Arsenophonus endosymbiont of Aleurodicus floccissimus]